jgi:hypothetical protein
MMKFEINILKLFLSPFQIHLPSVLSNCDDLNMFRLLAWLGIAAENYQFFKYKFFYLFIAGDKQPN